jgi:HEAT repeat protein
VTDRPYKIVRRLKERRVRRLKERRDVDALLALLEDTDLLIVCAAAETLADLNEQRAVEPLLRLVRRFSVQSQEWEVIATALARLETPGSAGGRLSPGNRERRRILVRPGGDDDPVRHSGRMDACRDG